MEGSAQNYYQMPYCLLPDIGYDSATTGATSGYIFVPCAQGFNYPQQTEEEEESSDITYTPLLTTSESAYSKVDMANIQSFDKEENDIDGPLYVGLHVSKAATEEEGESTELYLFGTADIFTDEASQYVYGNNLTLFTGVTTQFSGGEAESVIPVKSYETSNLVMSQAVVTGGMLIMLILIPVGLLAAGIIIWVKRRKR